MGKLPEREGGIRGCVACSLVDPALGRKTPRLGGDSDVATAGLDFVGGRFEPALQPEGSVTSGRSLRFLYLGTLICKPPQGLPWRVKVRV